MRERCSGTRRFPPLCYIRDGLPKLQRTWTRRDEYSPATPSLSATAGTTIRICLHLELRPPSRRSVEPEPTSKPDRVDLKEAFQKQAEVTVYLAIPKLVLGRPNVTPRRVTEARYFESELSVPDESRGGNDQDIQFREVNARLLLSTNELGGFETLPLARLKASAAS